MEEKAASTSCFFVYNLFFRAYNVTRLSFKVVFRVNLASVDR